MASKKFWFVMLVMTFGIILAGCATTADLGAYNDVSADKAATLMITGRAQGVVAFDGETVDWRAKPGIFANVYGGKATVKVQIAAGEHTLRITDPSAPQGYSEVKQNFEAGKVYSMTFSMFGAMEMSEE
jgi:hypothetical protein